MAYVRPISWRKMRLEQLEYLYGQYVRAWEGKHDEDDRGKLCRFYRRMEVAIKSLPAEPELYVRVAMDDKMRKDRAVMDKIAKCYEKGALRA